MKLFGSPSIDMKTPIRSSGRGGRWVYLLGPVLLVLLGGGIMNGRITFNLTGLWIPVAAWLGSCYGARGLLVVRIAGIPLLLLITYPGFHTGRSAGLYFAAILVCRLAGQGTFRAAALTVPSLPLPLLVPLFLGLAVNVHWYSLVGMATVGFYTDFAPYFWVLLIIVGMRTTNSKFVLLWLGIIAVVGSLLLYKGVHFLNFGDVRLTYWPHGIPAVFTGITAIITGRLLRDVGSDSLENSCHSWRPSPATISLFVLLLVSLVGSMFLVRDWTMMYPPPQAAWTLSTGFATVMVLFSIGLTSGLRGAIIAATIWLGMNVAVPFLVAPTAGFSSFLTFGPTTGFLSCRPSIDPLSCGPITIVSPRSFILTYYAYAAGFQLSFLDPVFAFFGAVVGVQLRNRRRKHAVRLSC
jgi:hypothetical protein